MPRNELKETCTAVYTEKYSTKKLCKWTIDFRSKTEKEKKDSILYIKSSNSSEVLEVSV